MPKEKPSPWPRSIAAFLIAAVFLLSWTIYKTSQMPVHEDVSFMATYQDVDMGSDTFVAMNNKFLRSYDILLVSDYEEKPLEQETYKRRGIVANVIKPWEEIIVQLVDSNGEAVSDGNIEVLLTRPTVRSFDREVSVVALEDGKFNLGRIQFENRGRWQLLVKGVVGDLIGFKYIDLYIE